MAIHASTFATSVPQRLPPMAQRHTGPRRPPAPVALDQARFEALANSAPVGLTVSQAGRIVYANPAIAAWLGLDGPEHLIGKSLREYLTQDGAEPSISASLKRRKSNGREEYLLAKADGTPLALEAVQTAIRWEGAPAQLETLTDVSERRRALEESEQRYRQLVAGALEGIVVHREFHPLIANQAAAEIFGYQDPAALLELRDWRRLFPKQARAELERLQQQALQSGQAPPAAELEGLRCDGTVVKLELRIMPVRWQGQAALQTTLTNLSAKHQVQQQLQQAQRLLHHTFHSIPHFLYAKDVRGRVILANEAMAGFFGLTPEQLQGKTANDLPFQTSSAKALLLRTQQRALATGQPQPLPEVELKDAHGANHWYSGILVPTLAEDGTVTGLVGWMNEVTESKRSAQALAESEERYRRLVEGPIQGIVVHRNGKPLYANAAFARIYGFSDPAEVLALPDLAALVSEPFRTRMRQYNSRLVNGKTAQEVLEFQSVRQDGSPLWTNTVTSVIHWQGEAALISAVMDMTERKRAEDELASSRRLMQTIFDTIPLLLFVKDRQLRFVMVNQAHAQFFGKQPPLLAGLPFDQMAQIPPEEARKAQDEDRRVLEAGEPVEIAEHPLQNFERHTRWLRGVKLPLRDEQGQATGVLGLVEDVTERREAAEALRASQQLLQTIFDAVPEPLFVKDRQGRFLKVNQEMARLYGLTPRDFEGQQRDFVAHVQADPQRVREQDEQVFATGERVESRDVVHPVPGGQARQFRFIKVPLRGPQGRIEGLVGLGIDMTERLDAEEAMRSSERLLQTIFDIIPHSLYVKNRDSSFRMVNTTMARTYGKTPQEMAGTHTTDLPGVDPQVLRDWLEQDRGVMETGRMSDARDLRFVTTSGAVEWRHVVKFPLWDDQRQVAGIVGMTEDVTLRRQAEELLRESQRILEAAQQVAHVGSWTTPLDGSLAMAWSTEVYRIAGLGPEQFDGRLESYLGLIHPDDLDYVRDVILAAIRRASFFELDHRLVRPDGGVHWVHVKAEVEPGEAGRPARMVGVIQDITDRKQAEDALRSSQSLLRTVFDTLPHLLAVKDRQGRFQMVNEAQVRFFGLKEDQILGRTFAELPNRAEDQVARVEQEDRRVLAGHSIIIPEVRASEVGGKSAWLRRIKLPIFDREGKVTGIVSLTEDISERKRADEELRSQRRLLQTVFDTIPHHLFVKDAEGRYLMMNHAKARFHGGTPERLQGMKTEEVPGILADQVPLMHQSDLRIIQTGQAAVTQDMPVDGADGSTHWFNVIKLPLRDESGGIAGVVALAEDVTERRRDLAELSAHRRLLQAVFDALPLWLTVRDKEDRFVIVNRRMAQAYGRDPQDFLGRVVAADPAQPEAAAISSLLDEVRRTHQPALVPEVRLTLPGGERPLLRIVMVPLFDASGAFDGTIGLGEDITERKRSELALLQAQKMESLGVLAGGVAHDFNNLLVTILGNASLALLKLPADTPAREELGQIELAGQRAAELCRQMLSYAGRSRMEVEAVTINTLVQEMTQLLRVSLPKGVSIAFRLGENLPAVQADPTQIRQVVMNLVINAGEAIGERAGTITLTSGTLEADREYLSLAHMDKDSEPGSYLFLEVSDTGSGMSPETLARIFDPFFTTKFTGRGLGLASVLGIIRSHKGGLRVYSELGVGTSFKVLLPAAGAVAVPPNEEPWVASWRGSGGVLVVDDEESIRSVALRMLQHLGFEVQLAASGEEALAQLRAGQALPSLVLLDLTMPGMSGEETLREMRKLHNDLRVILMSGYNEREVMYRFVGRNLAGFLQKPFRFEQLREKMRALLG